MTPETVLIRPPIVRPAVGDGCDEASLPMSSPADIIRPAVGDGLSGERATSAKEPRAAAFETRIVPPLLPAVTPTRPAFLAAASGWHSQGEPAARARHASDPAEVHVSIGRIEVTAVHEAQPPRRQQAHGPKPIAGLDQYLARRRSGRP